MAGEDHAYTAWLRTLPCDIGAERPTEPHHSPFGKGMGQRNHDHTSVPLCRRHHDEFHGVSGYFKGWQKARRKAWQVARAASYRTAYVATLAEQPPSFAEVWDETWDEIF